MKESRKSSIKISNSLLLNKITLAQEYLSEKLTSIDIKSLKISEYNQRYLKNKISGLQNILQIYGKLIYLSLKGRDISLDNFILVDYGGGSGLISFLAAQLGIGTVIYNDIYNISCRDVKYISDVLDLKLDHIVCGDIEDLVSYLRVKSLYIDAIVSYDVLEHIYDVGYHFKKLSCLSNLEFRIIYASGANIKNPWYVKKIKNLQYKAEYKTKDKVWGYKERDTLQPYYEARKKIISLYAPELSNRTIEQLAKSTRGLIKRDIEKCVNEFQNKGTISYKIVHPTNTCDPFTGNWCEHLMEFKWLRQTIQKAGFSVKIMPGYYNCFGSFPKKLIKISINLTINLLGRFGMFIAPYYVVFANFYKQTYE